MTGGILAYITLHSPHLLTQHGAIRSTIGIALIATALATLEADHTFPGFWAILPTLGAALVISADPNTWINQKLLSNRVAILIGKISYPLYLWHWPIISYIHIQKGNEITDKDMAIAVIISFILAWLAYRFIETPIRSGKKSRKNTILLLLALSICGALGLIIFLKDGLPLRKAAAPESICHGDMGHEPYFLYQSENFHICTPKEIAINAWKWENT